MVFLQVLNILQVFSYQWIIWVSLVYLTYIVSSFSENHPQWVTSLCVFIFFISFIFWLFVFLFLCLREWGILHVRLQLVLIEVALWPCRLITISEQLSIASTQQSLHREDAAHRPTDQHCSTAKTAQSCGNTAICKYKKVCRDKKSSLRATSGNIFAS